MFFTHHDNASKKCLKKLKLTSGEVIYACLTNCKLQSLS